MPIQSVNPATAEVLETYVEFSADQVEKKLEKARATFEFWRKTMLSERQKLMRKLAKVLTEKKLKLAELITLEMGKPIRQSIAEIEKCAWCAEYFAEKAPEFLAPEVVATDAKESFVTFEPLGPILAVMPWNFPFWQVARFIIPAALAGNVGVLKHASNVPQCALALEGLFATAGFPEGVFQTLLIGSDKVEGLIADPRIKAVTLTGSEHAGSKVGMAAGKHIKKSLLELGGSNAFTVLEDADMELAVTQAVIGRFQNAGQSCIAAKRFIVVEKITGEFLQKFKAQTERQKIGDPLSEETEIGPLSGKKILEDLERQVRVSVEMGAKILTGGKRWGTKGFFYEPTILTDVQKGMPVADEETFGPVAAVMVAKNINEAIRMANDTEFGLGVSLFTQNETLAKKLVPELTTSTVFVNGIVRSDPRLPFGGIGKSGHGRELSHYGLREFMNIKTVWVK